MKADREWLATLRQLLHNLQKDRDAYIFKMQNKRKPKRSKKNDAS